ncbi:MAG: benzoyl-CoA 2,3-epoxidase subunit BoxB [Myxococcales bacterium]|nr:benzoyl-CoA 2,3-epoxidase subunit BoxB [Polyangiaceae bacterium]MDW8249084.1 benzoyl-CoA 2,3-epoxidase subunit BoxB [Myxococcales bacterium]
MSLFDKIPNNVNLSDDKRLQRALETWQPDFINWWREMGPSGFQEDQVYLRTAISVSNDGWAHYDYVKMPEYRWGIFLTPPEPGRTISFGDHAGQPVWNEVPGELRNVLRRIIVTQADTEPASVEQQRMLGLTAPSLYDLRNLFQVNVEEGRHLWAMVHLLHQFFGRDGREEAEQLLQRRAGNPDTPRILSTFNEATDEWLSFFCFTMFTDRDGKYQLASLAESGFDPLSRATRFMLTEEAFHLFVGETGIDRIVRRSAQLTKMDPNGDARKHGGIDLPTVQKYINYWFSSAVELFGGEISTNAAEFFSTGLKGRYREKEKYQDHAALEGFYSLDVFENGRIQQREVPLRNALNEVLRDEYVSDCERAVRKWNRTIAAEGVGFELKLPSRKFNRKMGIYAGLYFDTDGNPISQEAFEARRDNWLPTPEDRAYVRSLMVPVVEPGKVAHWIAPPAKGIEGTPLDFEYVRGEGVNRLRGNA